MVGLSRMLQAECCRRNAAGGMLEAECCRRNAGGSTKARLARCADGAGEGDCVVFRVRN